MSTIDLGPMKATYYTDSESSSRLAALDAFVQRNERAQRILNAYADAEDGLTADEVSRLVSVNFLSGRPLVCRLHKEGYLSWMSDMQDSPIRRTNASGKYARVLEITIKGLKAVGQ